MNILILNYEYPPLGGGGAVVCRDLAEAMVRSGHTATVVTMGHPDLPEEETVNGVKVIRIRCMRECMHASTLREHLIFLRSAGKFLVDHLKTSRYDICHTHFIFPTGPLAYLIKRNAGIPYVITAHGSDVPGHNPLPKVRAMHFLLQPFLKQIIGNASAVVCPSGHLLGLLRRTSDRENYLLIPNGLDVEKFRAAPAEKERRILLMGRMQRSKNFQTIIKAAALIPKNKWNGWQIDVLGDGPYLPALEKLTDDPGLRENIRFYGWVNNGSAEHLDFVKKAAVYISASRFENSPTTVMESMAAGCYPLLSDISGHRQFFTGVPDPEQYLFPTDDEHALAQKLEILLHQETEALFRSFDMASYSIGRVTEAYLSLFEEVIRANAA